MGQTLLAHLVIAILIISTLILAIPSSAQPTASSFGVDDATGDPGTVVTVPVNITSVQNGPIQTIKLDMTYNDSVIELTSIQNGDLTPLFVGGILAWTNVILGANKKSMMLNTPTQAYAIPNGSSGSVVLLNFSVKNVPGAMSPMNIEMIDFTSTGLQSGTAPAKNGTFTVSGEGPPPVLREMTLAADPASIYLGGDTSIITATVYNDTNCTESMPDILVYFNTSLGSITNLSAQGGSITSDECWAQTNESGVALAVLTSGLELGDARVYACTGSEVAINETVWVEFKQLDYGMTLMPDNQTKETETNENATYYIEVKNIGTGSDLYSLDITSTEADFAELNKTEVMLSGGESEVVALNVASYFAGSYNTTVEAGGLHSSANVTVTTIVMAFHNLSMTVLPEELQIVAPGVNAEYIVTVTNSGNAEDRFSLITGSPAEVTATLNKNLTDLLSPEESETILLNLSSEREGDYIVNVTATSEGNASVSDTVTTRTAVTREGFKFDTGAGGYPSIAGVHRGTIIPNHTVIVKRMYTYPCAGTGGHTEYVAFYNVSTGIELANATLTGYHEGDHHTITFPAIFTLVAGHEYSYEIRTGSYPQIIPKQNCTTLDGSFINCTSFVDVNGNGYDNWIPALRLFP